MWRFYALVALVWIALMPPLFTGGRCTREFDAALSELTRNAGRLRNPDAAMTYWRERSVPVSLVTLDQCRQAKPRFLAHCGSGALVYAKVPVRNPVCSFYRDDAVKVQLHYDERDRLVRFFGDMSPFKSLPIPWLGTTIHWAR